MVIDTHAAIWYFSNSSEMSSVARESVNQAVNHGTGIFLSTISIVEIIYLIDKARLSPQTLSHLTTYLKLPDSSFVTQDVTPEIALAVQQIPRNAVPDMPDRIIAATALHLNLPLITRDRKIRSIQSIQTIW